jgi:hypothetical protein
MGGGAEEALMIERRDLERMRDWAHDQVAADADPSWAWYQHMKLRETLDAILSGMDRASRIERAWQRMPAPALPGLAGPRRRPRASAGSRPPEPFAR